MFKFRMVVVLLWITAVFLYGRNPHPLRVLVHPPTQFSKRKVQSSPHLFTSARRTCDISCSRRHSPYIRTLCFR